jgi:hypothetical protein
MTENNDLVSFNNYLPSGQALRGLSSLSDVT